MANNKIMFDICADVKNFQAYYMYLQLFKLRKTIILVFNISSPVQLYNIFYLYIANIHKLNCATNPL